MAQLATPDPKLYEQVRYELDELARLRDEIRLKIHLAGMDAKSTWAALEKQLEPLEERFGQQGEHVAAATRELAAALREGFLELRKTLL